MPLVVQFICNHQFHEVPIGLACSRKEQLLLGQLLQLCPRLPVVMLKDLLKLLGVEPDSFVRCMLLRKTLKEVEVIADDLNPPLHRTLHQGLGQYSDVRCVQALQATIAAATRRTPIRCLI